LGAWVITAGCEEGSLITDSGDLIIERRDKDRFAQYDCNAPSDRSNTAAGRRAAALYAYFNNVVHGREPQ